MEMMMSQKFTLLKKTVAILPSLVKSAPNPMPAIRKKILNFEVVVVRRELFTPKVQKLNITRLYYSNYKVTKFL